MKPIENAKTFSFTFEVAGTQYRKQPVENLTVGEQVLLVPEPDNAYDENAIMVKNEAHQLLGYVPADLAVNVAAFFQNDVIEIESAIVKSLVTASQRGPNCKNANLEIEVSASYDGAKYAQNFSYEIPSFINKPEWDFNKLHAVYSCCDLPYFIDRETGGPASFHKDESEEYFKHFGVLPKKEGENMAEIFEFPRLDCSANDWSVNGSYTVKLRGKEEVSQEFEVYDPCGVTSISDEAKQMKKIDKVLYYLDFWLLDNADSIMPEYEQWENLINIVKQANSLQEIEKLEVQVDTVYAGKNAIMGFNNWVSETYKDERDYFENMAEEAGVSLAEFMTDQEALLALYNNTDVYMESEIMKLENDVVKMEISYIFE